MPFSQIIPPSPCPTESKRLFYTSVSLLMSRIQGYCYHLSKFHIYVLVYCIGVFLSGFLMMVIMTNVRWYLLVILICTSLIISNEHFFSCAYWPWVCLL